ALPLAADLCLEGLVLLRGGNLVPVDVVVCPPAAGGQQDQGEEFLAHVWRALSWRGREIERRGESSPFGYSTDTDRDLGGAGLRRNSFLSVCLTLERARG